MAAVVNSIKSQVSETINSSWDLAKNKYRAISALDFVMQIQPSWILYLAYTGVRCASLVGQYAKAESLAERCQVWEKAQVYLSVKVVGLVVSQVALTILSLIMGIIPVLVWGGLLTALSVFAYNQAQNDSNYLPRILSRSFWLVH